MAERRNRPPTPYTQIALLLGRNAADAQSRHDKLLDREAEDVSAMTPERSPYVDTGMLRGRQLRPCAVPLRTLVIGQRATRIQI